MFDFLKKIIKPKENLEIIAIRYDAIPALLEERKASSHTRFLSESAEPVRTISNGIAQLQHIVNSLDGASHDPALHPKLITIAKNSLPQFVRSMNTALARELPEDPEEFYAAAVECVKSCLNSTRGPGRYLVAVFPEEMKSVKEGIDAIGREINTLTSVLSAYRTETERIMQVQQAYMALVDIQEDLDKSVAKEGRIAERIQDLSARITTAGAEIESLRSPEKIQELDTLRSSCSETEKKRDGLARTYASLSMTASHVLRKAEKIAAKQKHHEEVSLIHATTALLSDHCIPDPAILTGALASACPIALQMIERGEITLKNKEERTLFSDPERFCSEIGSVCADLIKSENDFRIAEEFISTHPLVVRTDSLEREKNQFDAMLKKEQESRDDLLRWRQKTEENIPVLKEELYKKIELMTGGSVQLQFDDPAPERG